MSTAALRLDFVQPGIARITYDQPGSRANTLNQAVQTEFENILTELEKTPNLQGADPLQRQARACSSPAPI